MKIENPLALRYIMQDDIYLLNEDKVFYSVISESPAEIPVPVEETPPLSFNYLGQNKKHFLVIGYYPATDFINDIHLTALQNIIKRLELGMEDIAILNRAKYPDVTFAQLVEFFSPSKVLILGDGALPAGIEAPAFNQPQNIGNCRVLFSYSFDGMMDSNENKKAFWEQMKQL